MIILGAGETARLAYEYFSTDSPFSVVGFAVHEQFLQSSLCLPADLPLYNLSEPASLPSPNSISLFCALGSSRLNSDRMQIYSAFKARGYNFVSYISSRAFISPSAIIGDNAFILEHNVVQSKARIGSNVTLWSGNHIGHHASINDHVFISSHVVIAGYASVGSNCFIGINASVADYCSVADFNYIGAGSLIGKSSKPYQVFRNHSTSASPVSSQRFCKL